MNFLQKSVSPSSKFVSPSRALPIGPSLVLDIVRSLAAFMVAFGHLSQPYFSTGMRNLTIYAVGAVAVFFVLSGFVIRYISLTRVSTIRDYAIDRASRIYSVAIPALLLTIILDTVSYHVNPAYYIRNWGHSLEYPVVKVSLNALFLSQAWFHNVSPLSNSPFWSLGYECVYYALYGVSFYLTGTKRVIGLILTFLLVGPTVFLVFPIWLLGVVAYDVFAEGKLTPVGAGKLLGVTLLALAGVYGTKYMVLEHIHLPFVNVYSALGGTGNVGAITAIPATLLLLVTCWSTKRLHLNEKHWIVLGTRRLADATFTLYLMHFPILVLLGSTVPYNHGSWVARLAILAGLIFFCVLITPWLNQLKQLMRKTLAQKPARRPRLADAGVVGGYVAHLNTADPVD